MKLIKYVLNEDGSIPDYIIDGGYYPVQNSNQPPQDITLIGLVDDSVVGEELSNFMEIKNYLISIGGNEWTDENNNPLDLDNLSQLLIDKLL